MYGTAYGTAANWAAVSSMTCCGIAAAVAEGLVEVMPTIGMKYVGVGILPEIITAPCCVTAAKVADALTLPIRALTLASAPPSRWTWSRRTVAEHLTGPPEGAQGGGGTCGVKLATPGSVTAAV